MINRRLKNSAVIGAAVILGGGAIWFFGKGKPLFPLPTYHVLSVTDGDTFQTLEKQRIRLTDIQAPELENCGGSEAKQTLEKLILNKDLYIKVLYRDANNRLISEVYNQNGNVSEQLVKVGAAYYMTFRKENPKLKMASQIARKNKLGIFSDRCIQDKNLKQPKCVIKGNKPEFDNSVKNYRFPGCGKYVETQVELYKGDQWFCTEKEAQKAGFSKGGDCYQQNWK